MQRVLRPAITALAFVAAILVGAAAIVRFEPDSVVGRRLIAALAPASRPVPGDAALPALSIGGPFTLVATDGRIVHATSFGDRFLLIYFGYTTCPDICPTTLQTIAAALHMVGARADRVAPLFITVDPARDRPDVLARYAGLFDPRIIALTGSPAQIAAVEDAYRVYAARVQQPGTDTYTMDHTSFVYLMDPGGQLRGLFDRTVTAAALAAAIDRAIG